MLALRSARVTIFAGPFSPKFMAEALVTSEKVGEGGPSCCLLIFVDIASDRSERALCMRGPGWMGRNVGTGMGEAGGDRARCLLVTPSKARLRGLPSSLTLVAKT